MSVVLHHLDQSRSHRILWLLEELGVEYEIVQHYRNKTTMRAPKALREIHPLGKSPVVVFDDGIVVAESGAIIEELVDRFGPHLRPDPGTEAFRRYRYFMHYAEGSLMPPLLVKLIMGKLQNAPVPFFVKPLPRAIAKQVNAEFTDPEIKRQLTFLNAELADREYFAGDTLTAADMQMSFPLVAAASRADVANDYPNVHAYLQRITTLPAYKRADAAGGELNLGQL
jgi:glutathione S-transferase